MSEKIERFFLQIKEMKFMFFIPMIVYYVFFPLCVFAYMQNPIGNVDTITVLSDISYSLVPIISVWWVFLFLREIVEGEGREVLILGGGVSQIMGIFYGLHSICMIPVFFVLDDSDGSVMSLYLQMLVVSFFMYGLVYFLCVVLENIVIPILLTMIYSIYATTTSEELSLLQFEKMNNVDWMSGAIPFLLLGIILWIVGHKGIKRFR